MDAILRELSRIASAASMAPATITMTNAISGTPTGNNAVEALTRQHNWIFAGYMVLLLAGLILTYFVWKSGNRVQQAIQDDASARIEEAKTAAATANERAGKLENDNLKLRGDLNTESGKVAGLQKAAADAKAAQQRVEIDLAKQQERAAIAERSLLQLKEHLKDRTISDEQRGKIITFLQTTLQNGIPCGKVLINWVAGEPDAYSLAMRIQSILKDAGCSDVREMAAVGATGTGMFIAVHSTNSPPKHAGALQHAFISAGVPLTPYEDEKIPVDEVQISIAHKTPVP